MDLRTQYAQIVEGLMAEAHKFYEMKYQMSNGGNLSARIPGTGYMIVKGTDVDFAHVRPDTLVVTDLAGKVVEGEIRPSKESLLHGALYERLPDMLAIMHCHSPWATAWAAGHESLAFSTYHSAMKLHGACPVFDTQSYVVPQTFFKTILSAFDRHPGMNSFLLRGHGQVALAGDIHAAASLAELVEETAMIAMLSKAGPCAK